MFDTEIMERGTVISNDNAYSMKTQNEWDKMQDKSMVRESKKLSRQGIDTRERDNFQELEYQRICAEIWEVYRYFQ